MNAFKYVDVLNIYLLKTFTLKFLDLERVF